MGLICGGAAPGEPPPAPPPVPDPLGAKPEDNIYDPPIPDNSPRVDPIIQ